MMSLDFFYYGFMTSAVNNEGIYSIWNINAPKVNNQSDFLRLIVYKADLKKFFNTRKRARLYRILESNLLDEGVTGYDPPVENARIALQDSNRVNILTQAYIDCLFRNLHPEAKAPVINSDVIIKPDGEYTINFNYNFSNLDNLLDNKLIFRRDIPIIGEAQSNRLIWTASKYGWDLLLGDVMSTVVANKLVEASDKINKAQRVIKELKEQVEFPDIYWAVNNNQIDLPFILKIRNEALKFRNWLQQEGERDRNAIIAYHTEVTKAVGITKNIGSTLKLLGAIGQIGSPVISLLPSSIIEGAVVGSTAEAGGIFLNWIGNSLVKDWRPVVFGEHFINEYGRKQKRS